MSASNCLWIASFLLSLMASDIGVFGRAVGFLSQSPKSVDKTLGATLRTNMLETRWRRGVSETHRDRCAELEAPWLENTRQAPGDNGTLLQLRVRPLSPGSSRGLVFPGKSLFSFVRRVYRCCQEGVNCRSVKGIQGRLRGDADVEFILTKEILSLTIMRAELHLQLSNPQHVDIHPMLPSVAKHSLPTRYSLGSRGDTVDLRVDLLFLFGSLQEVVGGAGRGPSLANMRRVPLFSNGDQPGEKSSLVTLQQHTGADVWGDGDANALPDLDLGLILGCSQDGSGVPCGAHGVHLTHTPFMTLYYR